MRKNLKKKKHSCSLCKPHKMGISPRFKEKENFRLRLFEKTRGRDW